MCAIENGRVEPVFERLPESALGIDRSYQRGVKGSVVKKIRSGFTWDAFGAVRVARRRDNSNWVVDGQQRLTAARELGVNVVPCLVSPSSGPQEEAELFSRLNGDRGTVTRDDRFRADLCAGDEFALEVAKAVSRGGGKLLPGGPSSRYTFTKCTPFVTLAKGKGGGPDLVTRTVRVVLASWGGDSQSKESNIIDGVGYFLRHNPNAQDERLVSILERMGPDGVRAAAAHAKGFIGGQGARIKGAAQGIEMEYNKRLRPNRRLNGVIKSLGDVE